jgi:hypothetical protein
VLRWFVTWCCMGIPGVAGMRRSAAIISNVRDDEGVPPA